MTEMTSYDGSDVSRKRQARGEARRQAKNISKRNNLFAAKKKKWRRIAISENVTK